VSDLAQFYPDTVMCDSCGDIIGHKLGSRWWWCPRCDYDDPEAERTLSGRLWDPEDREC
jgi:hypothetical protein